MTLLCEQLEAEKEKDSHHTDVLPIFAEFFLVCVFVGVFY
jgi:hypothetical protein